MLKVGKYPIGELKKLLGTADKQGIDRKLTRYGVAFSSTGWADSRVYDITNIPDPFRLYCVLMLGIPAQADFDKMFKSGDNSKKVLADIKGLLCRKEYEDLGYNYWRL